MQSVGTLLRHAREAQSRTLDDLHAATRISLRTLAAIEADDLSLISSAFLYKSFVRQISQELGLDFAQLGPALQSNVDTIPAPLMPGEGAAPLPNVPALRIGRKRRPKLVYALSSFALLLVACSGFYAVWQTGKPADSQPLPKAPRAELDQSGRPAPLPDLSQNRGGFTLALSATEPAWLSIIADGKQSFRGILERAETKTLEGHRTARIKTANAGALKVTFNGHKLGALGPPGQARTVLFTKNRYEVLTEPARVSLDTLNQSAALTLPSQQLLPIVLNPAAAAASDAPEQ